MRMSRWRRDQADPEETFDALQVAAKKGPLDAPGPAFTAGTGNLSELLQAGREAMVRLFGPQIDERKIA